MIGEQAGADLVADCSEAMGEASTRVLLGESGGSVYRLSSSMAEAGVKIEPMRCSAVALRRSALCSITSAGTDAGVVGESEKVVSKSSSIGSNGRCWKNDARRGDCSQRYRAMGRDFALVGTEADAKREPPDAC